MNDEIQSLIIGIIIGILIGSLITDTFTNHSWKQEILNRGLAAYCPLDGKWAWKGECAQ